MFSLGGGTNNQLLRSYIMLATDAAGAAAGANFHGRFFGGRQLSVQYFPRHVYVRKFPVAA
jgi:hypothetical protein